MKFLADMCISSSTVNFLRVHKCDILHVRDRGLQKATDTEILDIAIKENRSVLTFDLDFTDFMAASGENCQV